MLATYFNWDFTQQLVAGVIAGLVTGVVAGRIILRAQLKAERQREWNNVAREVAATWEEVLMAAEEPQSQNLGYALDVMPMPAQAIARVLAGRPLVYWHEVLIDDERMHVIERFQEAFRGYIKAARALDIGLTSEVRKRLASLGVSSDQDERFHVFIVGRILEHKEDVLWPHLDATNGTIRRQLHDVAESMRQAPAVWDYIGPYLDARRELVRWVDHIADVVNTEEDPSLDPRRWRSDPRWRLRSWSSGLVPTWYRDLQEQRLQGRIDAENDEGDGRDA
jgi:hypothetical protein